MTSSVHPPSTGLAIPAGLLDALETGVAYLHPVYATGNSGELLALVFEQVNAVAQRLLGLPEFPVGSVAALLPAAAGFADFCRDTFYSGGVGHYELPRSAQPAPGWRVAAQRQGEQLVAVVTAVAAPAAPLPLASVVVQAPVAMGILRGPSYQISYFNLTFQQLLPGQELTGLPLAQLLPQPLAQGLLQLLDHVYITGESYSGFEKPLTLAQPHGPATTTYLNLTIQAYQEADQPVCLAIFAYDVTQQVLARRQVHKQKLNKKLRTANDELRANNQRLAHAQQQLRQLNQELEVRVAAGVAAAQQARNEADCQRQRLERLFRQSPAAISILSGPDLVYEFVNARYQQLFPGRQLLGRTLREARPDSDDQVNPDQLRAVYETGVTYHGHVMMLRVPNLEDGQVEERYFDCVYQPRYDGRNLIDGVLIFALEVTERVHARLQMQQLNAELESRVATRTQEAQAARAEAEAKHQQLGIIIEQAPMIIAYISGPELRITSINPAACLLWGRTAAEVLDQPMTAALPHLRGHGFEERLATVMQTQQPYRGQGVKVTVLRDGQLTDGYFNFVYQPIPNDQDGTTDVLIVGIEVTEQVHAHQQVQEFNRVLETRVAEGVAEAQRARAEAEYQRQRLESFFKQAPAAICVFDGPNLVYELVNPAYQQRFPGRQLLGLPLLDALPELTGHALVARLRNVYATGITHEGHETMLTVARPDDGKIEDAYFDCVYQPRYNEQGVINGVLLFALDVTAKVQAQHQAALLQAEVLEAAQREAQAQATFHQVFDQTTAAITFLRGPDFRFEYFNQAYELLFPGIAQQGVPLAKALVNTEPQGFMSLMAKVYKTGRPYVGNEVPVVITQLNGIKLTKYLNFTFQAFWEQEIIVGISIFAYDVTEQVLARRQREADQAQLQHVFEQAPVALALLAGPDYIVEVANPAICDYWDQESAAIVGRPFFEVRPHLLHENYPEVLATVRRTGQPYLAEEKPIKLRRQGREDIVYFHFVFQPLLDAQNQVTAVMIVATDVSQRVLGRQQLAQANDALRATNAQLTRTNTDLDNFIYTASHDLKAPISNIESLLLLLRKQLPPEARRAELVPKVLGMMQEAIERFQLTIAQLTDISRLQQAHTELVEAVDLQTAVDAVRLDLASELAATGARLTVDVAGCPTITLAPHHLRSIVYNLLSNALKYHHPDRVPEVHIQCRVQHGFTVLSVHDNGLGLSPAQQEKVFGLFRRLHAHVEGTGVGLYMVKRIIENAGGTISVQSAPDVGSTFTISLPPSAPLLS